MARRAQRLSQASPPGQPPTYADFAALVKKVNTLAVKAGVAPLSEKITAAIPSWKRWVGGEGEHDVTGLRDRLATLTSFVNQIKHDDVDPLKQQVLDLRIDVTRLQEAPAPRPFP